MVLPIPFFIYGTITNKSGGIVNGATVSVSTAITTTDSTGKYQLDIEDVATDGVEITVIATYNNVSSSGKYTVDLNDIGKIINFMIPYDTKVGLYGLTYSKFRGDGYMKVRVI